MLDGGAPYRDVWDFKPPGIYLYFALARIVFGETPTAIRCLEMISLASLVPAYCILSRRALGEWRAGILGASLAIIGYVPFEFWHTAQPEGFGAVLLAWALVLATTDEPDEGRSGEPGSRSPTATRPQLLAWAGCAALYCCAGLLKPPLGGGILVSFGLIVRQRWRRGDGGAAAILAPAAAFTLGGLLPLLVVSSYFASMGALTDLHEVFFVFAPHYTRISLETYTAWELVASTLTRRLVELAPFSWPGLVCLAVLPGRGDREASVSVHVLGVVGFSLVGIALQAKFFIYHHAVVVIMLALLAGWGWWKLWLRAQDRPLAWGAIVLVLFALAQPIHPAGREFQKFERRVALRYEAATQPERRAALRDELHSRGDVSGGMNRRVAEWLAANTPGDQPIYIWGFEPTIYGFAGRRPATRYIYNVPQLAPWTMKEARVELMEDLRTTPPSAIVVVHNDRLTKVTGRRLDSAALLKEFSALQHMLETEYEFAIRIGEMDIHRRRAGS